MNLSQFTGQLNEVVESTGFEALPVGKYLAVIDKVEVKSNSKNTGSLFAIDMTIAEGEYTNRTIKHSFNLSNPSAIAVQISQQQLKQLGVAINPAADLNNVDEGYFLNKVIVLDLAISPAKGDYAAGNNVKNFMGKDTPTGVSSKQPLGVNGASQDTKLPF